MAFVVLYHCCNSFALAKAVERHGFEPHELVQVTDVLPEACGRARPAYPPFVVLGAPFEFDIDDYPPASGERGSHERLMAGLVLNQFRRAAWPE